MQTERIIRRKLSDEVLERLLRLISEGDLKAGDAMPSERELMERFGSAGKRDRAESWVGSGANQPVDPSDLEQALGDDTLDDLTRTTGLSRSEILDRLARNLPQTVDRFTPQGRLPTEDEAQGLL